MGIKRFKPILVVGLKLCLELIKSKPKHIPNDASYLSIGYKVWGRLGLTLNVLMPN
jgi:hypothetical protein